MSEHSVRERAAQTARTVDAAVNYSGDAGERPRYHANDKSRDVLALESWQVPVVDGRALDVAPTLEAEGFKLVHAPSAVTDHRDPAQADRYKDEIRALIERETGAELVLISSPGVLRFSERSPDSGELDNSRPARFIHNDVSEPTARAMAVRALEARGERLEDYSGFASYNVWRPFTPPPQDVPLAMLDTRTLRPENLIEADAVFDLAGKPDWSFEGFLVRHDPAHRWVYFSDMGPEDALLFTTMGYRDGVPFMVPHTGFDDPSCPDDAPPRASIEMRAMAFFR
jgi:hypothetical protein